MEKTCCFIDSIIPNYYHTYTTNVLQDIKDIVDFEKYILSNYPVYLQDNLIIKNIDNDFKNYIWIRAQNTIIHTLYKKKRLIAEQFLPKHKKFNIIYSAYKLANKNNTSIEIELNKFYKKKDGNLLKEIIYYMMLTNYALR